MTDNTYSGDIPQHVSTLEWEKFCKDSNNKVAVKTVSEIVGALSGSFSPSGLNIGGKITEVTINNLTWTALPATTLTGRNALSIQNISGQEIKVNYDPLTAGYVGMVIGNGGERNYDVSTIQIYAKSKTSSCVINVEEIA